MIGLEVCNVRTIFVLYLNKYDMKFQKSMRLRYLEFFSSMKLLKDSLDKVAHKQDEYFISLSVQLRSMFIPKRSRNQASFENSDEFISIKLAKELGVNLDLFVSDKEYECKECQYFTHIFSTSLEPNAINSKRQSLLEWLENDIVEILGKKYKIWEVIKAVSDQNGGAHFDKEANEENVRLCTSVNQAGILIVNLILANVGRILYGLGLKILKSLFDFQVVVSFSIPLKQVISGKNIMTFNYKNAYSPLAFYVTEQNMLRIKIADSKDNIFEIDVFDFRYNDGLLVVNVSCELTERMEMILKVYCNNVFTHLIVHSAIFVGHNFMVNSLVTFSDVDVKIGLSSLYFYSFIDKDYAGIYNRCLEVKKYNTGILNGMCNAQFDENNNIKFEKPLSYMRFSDFISC